MRLVSRALSDVDGCKREVLELVGYRKMSSAVILSMVSFRPSMLHVQKTVIMMHFEATYTIWLYGYMAI